MEQHLTTDDLVIFFLTGAIWMLVGIIATLEWVKMKKHRMAVSEKGELVEVDEAECMISE